MILYRQGIIAALRYGSYMLQMYYAPISQEVELGLARPLQPNRPYDIDTVVPHPVAWPDELWVDLVNAAKDEFEVNDASTVFSMQKVQEAKRFGANDFRLISDAGMTDGRVARLLGSIPEGGFNLKLKFFRRRGQGDWFIEEHTDPIRQDTRRGTGNCYNNQEHQARGVDRNQQQLCTCYTQSENLIRPTLHLRELASSTMWRRE